MNTSTARRVARTILGNMKSYRFKNLQRHDHVFWLGVALLGFACTGTLPIMVGGAGVSLMAAGVYLKWKACGWPGWPGWPVS